MSEAERDIIGLVERSLNCCAYIELHGFIRSGLVLKLYNEIQVLLTSNNCNVALFGLKLDLVN
jgi:hypothetical protein